MRFIMLVIPKGYENAAPDAMPDPKAVEKKLPEMQRQAASPL